MYLNVPAPSFSSRRTSVKDQVHIRNAEAAQLARVLARQTGKTMGQIVLEALRLIGSLIVWNTADRSRSEAEITGITRQQLRFCVPFGVSAVLGLVCRNLGNVAVVKYLGAAALAHRRLREWPSPPARPPPAPQS